MRSSSKARGTKTGEMYEKELIDRNNKALQIYHLAEIPITTKKLKS